MKTTLELPDDLMREVKIRAAQQGKKLKDMVTETLRKGLYPESSQENTSRPLITRDPVVGHLVVEGPVDVPASKMTIEELLQLEQDSLHREDLQRVGLL